MNESERIQRLKSHCDFDAESTYNLDDKFAERIAALLNHVDIDKGCMVDAYYYDFSVIPDEKQKEHDLWRDCYLIFGITKKGDIVSKWVDRWELDSDDPIVDGKIIPNDNPPCGPFIPDIKCPVNPNLLSVPVPNTITELFNPQVCAPQVENVIDVKAMDICED